MITAQHTGQDGRVTARPALDDLMERAASLRPVLAARARATEADRRISPEVTTLLRDNELLSLCKPARFGGFEYGPSAMVRLGYELGQACGSTAWCATLANSNAWFASYWPLSAQDDVWGARPDNLIAAPLAPTGKCEPVEDGYRLWGRWPFASNCENSDWAIISAMVPAHDGAPAGPAWFLTPIDTLQVDQGTWHMAGLQGTGSKTLHADEPVFVPGDRIVRLSDVFGVTTPGASIESNVMAQFGWSTFGAAALVAPLLGMARGTLDWFIENMRAKIRPGHTTSAAENPFVQERAGRASVALDSALSLLLSDLERVEQIVFAGGRLDTEQRVLTRRNFGFATRQSVEIVNDLFEAAGASSAELDKPIQRFWRDVNAGARHVSLDEQSIMAMTGQQLFGLTPTGAF